MSSEQIYVSIMLGDSCHLVGRLWFHQRKGRESATFAYEQDWLDHPESFALEPALQLMPGVFHTQAKRGLFGAIGDSAPDRWGRVLMKRQETKRARSFNETPQRLSELDFLLGVNDESRQGALRFSKKPEGPYLSPQGRTNIPPVVELPQLLAASQRFLSDNESAQDLQLLLAPGSSLGGARPKASVRDHDDHLAIAKLPRQDDNFDIVIWEAVALQLAKKAGIQVPEWRLEHIGNKPVLIVRRFDRCNKQRIPFLSAMSMLEAQDNEQASYLDIAYATSQNGGRPGSDLQQLWRRIVFNVLISNVDDHLRNHGFVYERDKGWCLSPAYDLNPTPTHIKPRVLSTSINYDDPTASLKTAVEVCKEFRLNKDKAHNIVKEVVESVSQWRNVANKLGLNAKAINNMASAFEHDDYEQASKIN